MIPEILAPAGGKTQALAAMEAGAKALYVGLNRWSARKNAENFDFESLTALVNEAHAREVKVYIAINTLILEKELKDLLLDLEKVYTIGVDAVIFQDYAIYVLVKKWAPHWPLHASTQTGVVCELGAFWMDSLGVKRVVLARELGLENIQKIVKVSPSIEKEVFVHGSMCYAYSGMCLFSAFLNKKFDLGGNRGGCLYSCRQFFQYLHKNIMLMNMKDLFLADSLKEIIKIPIESLKIEGRRKDAQYVATAVSLYQEALYHLFPQEVSKPMMEKSREKHLYSFQRETTASVWKSENPLSHEKNTHEGIEIGKILSQRNDFLEIHTKENLHLYDGLGFFAFIKGERVFYEFSLRHFKKEATKIIIQGHEKFPPMCESSFYKTRSNELKQEVEKLLKTKEKWQPFISCVLNIRVEEKGIFFEVLWGQSCEKKKEFFYLRDDDVSVGMDSLDSFQDWLEDTFKVLGQAQVKTKVNALVYRSYPKSYMKNIKRMLCEDILKEKETFYWDFSLKKKEVLKKDIFFMKSCSLEFLLKMKEKEPQASLIYECKAERWDSKWNKILCENKIYLFLPSVCDDLLFKDFQENIPFLTHFEIDHPRWLKKVEGKTLIGGERLYAYNSLSRSFFEEFGIFSLMVGHEIESEIFEDLPFGNYRKSVSDMVPLMYSRHCLWKDSCASTCPSLFFREISLKGETFLVENKHCFTTIYGFENSLKKKKLDSWIWQFEWRDVRKSIEDCEKQWEIWKKIYF